MSILLHVLVTIEIYVPKPWFVRGLVRPKEERREYPTDLAARARIFEQSWEDIQTCEPLKGPPSNRESFLRPTGKAFGYMPEKMFYGAAGAQVNVPGPPTPNVLIRIAQDLDDDNSISYFDQILLKDSTTRDAYRFFNTIAHFGDKW